MKKTLLIFVALCVTGCTISVPDQILDAAASAIKDVGKGVGEGYAKQASNPAPVPASNTSSSVYISQASGCSTTVASTRQVIQSSSTGLLIQQTSVAACP